MTATVKLIVPLHTAGVKQGTHGGCKPGLVTMLFTVSPKLPAMKVERVKATATYLRTEGHVGVGMSVRGRNGTPWMRQR